MRVTRLVLLGGVVFITACSGAVSPTTDGPTQVRDDLRSTSEVAAAVPIETRERPSIATPRRLDEAISVTNDMTGSSLEPAPVVSSPRAPIPPGATLVTPPSSAALDLSSVSPDNTGSVPNGSPCTAQSTHNYGTPSINQPRISLIYWGAWRSRSYDAYWSALANTPAYYNRMREYGSSNRALIAGSWGTSYVFPSGATGALTEATLEAGIQSAIGSYQPTGRDIFMVLLPNGTSALFDTQGGSTSHHSSYTATNGKLVPWGVTQYDSRTSYVEWRLTHEVMESITDPNATSGCTNGVCKGAVGTGWHDPEIGDPCNNNTGEIAGLTVQKMWSQSACRCVVEEDLNNVDVLADGEYAYTVQSNNETWYANGFSTDWNFGDSEFDEPYAGDFNGDGRTEFALLRQSSAVTLTLNIETGLYSTFDIGAFNDVPVPGDYDLPQDGKTDLAVWQPALGWRVISSATGVETTTTWGTTYDIAVPADYDGDGTTDIAFVRPSNGTWYIISSKTGSTYATAWSFTWGDIPIAADFNGDGLADYAFFRPSTATWWVDYSSPNVAYTIQWGVSTDIPLGRDIDGDWLADLTVYRPSTATFYSIFSNTWTTGTFSGEPAGIPIGQVYLGTN